MEVIGLAIGALLALLYVYVIEPVIKYKRELRVQQDYFKFQQELDKAKEKNRQHFEEIRKRQFRYEMEMRQLRNYQDSCMTLVRLYKDEIDREEWEEWVLCENGACLPVSMGRVFKEKRGLL